MELLQPDDFPLLYEKLRIMHRHVMKAELRANTTDPDIKAKSVLRQWKQKKGRRATRRAILTALRRCKKRDAMRALEEKWKEPGTVIIRAKRTKKLAKGLSVGEIVVSADI